MSSNVAPGSALQTVQDALRATPGFLSSPAVISRHGWKRKDGGHIIVVNNHDGPAYGGLHLGLLTTVGRAVDGRSEVEGLGSWRGSYEKIEGAKFVVWLERPDGTVFTADWDAGITNGLKMQGSICDGKDCRNWIKHDRSGALMRFTQGVFEKKAPNTEEGFNPADWQVDDELLDKFNKCVQSNHLRPITVYDENGVLVHPLRIAAALRGSIVKMSYLLKHWEMKVQGSNAMYDSFTGHIVRIDILIPGAPDQIVNAPMAPLANNGGGFMPVATGQMPAGHALGPAYGMPLAVGGLGPGVPYGGAPQQAMYASPAGRPPNTTYTTAPSVYGAPPSTYAPYSAQGGIVANAAYGSHTTHPAYGHGHDTAGPGAHGGPGQNTAHGAPRGQEASSLYGALGVHAPTAHSNLYAQSAGYAPPRHNNDAISFNGAQGQLADMEHQGQGLGGSRADERTTVQPKIASPTPTLSHYPPSTPPPQFGRGAIPATPPRPQSTAGQFGRYPWTPPDSQGYSPYGPPSTPHGYYSGVPSSPTPPTQLRHDWPQGPPTMWITGNGADLANARYRFGDEGNMVSSRTPSRGPQVFGRPPSTQPTHITQLGAILPVVSYGDTGQLPYLRPGEQPGEKEPVVEKLVGSPPPLSGTASNSLQGALLPSAVPSDGIASKTAADNTTVPAIGTKRARDNGGATGPDNMKKAKSAATAAA